MPDREALFFSGLLHLMVAVMIVVGLPSFFQKRLIEPTAIAVEVVNIAPETHATQVNPNRPVPKAKPEDTTQNQPPPTRELPKPPPVQAAPPSAAAPPPPPPLERRADLQKPAVPPPPPPPAPPSLPAPSVPTPPPPQIPTPQAELPLPPPPKPPEPQPKPPEPPPLPTPKPEVAKAAPPKPPLPQPKPQPAKAKDDLDLNNLLKNLKKAQQAQNQEPTQKQQVASAAPQRASSQPRAPLGSQVTASEIDVVRQQIEECWNFDPGARDAANISVDIDVAMNPDGTVRESRITSRSNLGDPYYRAAAESALRAVQNEECHHELKFPPDKYASWRTFTLTFSPKDLLQ